jgi:hypothetical protein
MIERFQYYLDENLVRKVSVDKEEARSLMKRAVHVLATLKDRK